jgi:penicillin-binding protein 2
MSNLFIQPLDDKKKYRVTRTETFEMSLDGKMEEERESTQHNTIRHPILDIRLSSLYGFILLSAMILLGKIIYLQIFQGVHYDSIAQRNRIRVEEILPRRGIIFDRTGTSVVKNIPLFSIALLPIQLPRDEFLRAKTLLQISELLEMRVSELYDIISEVGIYYSNPIIIKEDISYEDAIRIQIEGGDIPSLIFQMDSRREYLSHEPQTVKLPDDPYFYSNDELKDINEGDQASSWSHILGYVGTITKEELKETHNKYLYNDKTGKNGLEKYYEPILRGKLGQKYSEVDAYGKVKQVIAYTEPRDGKNIFLTIDAKLQSYTESVLETHLQVNKKKRGVVIIMNPTDGSLLAMVSLPAYDLNSFSRGISHNDYRLLLADENQPLFNRAISGNYPSGSTVKPIIAAAALSEKIINANTTFLSTGGLRVGRWFFPDWRVGGHGPTNLNTALAWSVNTYFYYIGGGYDTFEGLGLDRLLKYFQKFQLGSTLGIDLPSEATGFLPSHEWKEKTKNERWYIGDTYHLSIGQGDLLVTPLQVVSWMSFFANSGTLYRPHLILGSSEVNAIKTTPNPAEILTTNIISENDIHLIRQGLRSAVLWGSAQRLNDLPVTVAAKTGTAQWNTDKMPHSWLTAFAPYENSEIVITTLVEEGGEGSGIALDVTKEILWWYFTVLKKN